MKEYKAPSGYKFGQSGGPLIFLGGSIEMGVAEKWQDRFVNRLSDLNCTILNPRRDDWDSTWEQDPTPGTKFHEQVHWELQGQYLAEIIVYYFDPSTKSPITLMELGLFGGDAHASGRKVVVCCPKEFWRYGNVNIVCDWCDIPLVETFGEMVDIVRQLVQEY